MDRSWSGIVTGIEANRSYTDNAVVAGKNLSGEFQEPKIIGTMLGNNSAYIGGESYTFSFFTVSTISSSNVIYLEHLLYAKDHLSL